MTSAHALWATGKVGRTVIARVLPGQDLIAGIEAVCKEAGIRQGTIQCCIGSLQKTTIMWLVPKSEAKVGAAYCAPQVIEGPIELDAAQGTIAPAGQDEMFVHLHGILTDKDGRLWGGHFAKDGNPVLVTTEIVITDIEGMHMTRAADEAVGMTVMIPNK